MRSPRLYSLFSLCLLFFCGHVLAVSAVIGVDLGTEYIKAALVKPGIPLEIVLTKDSRRKETSAIAFKKSSAGGPKDGAYPERAYGSDAVALAARFPGDVYPNLKTLLGLPVDNDIALQYSVRHPALSVQPYSTRRTVAFQSHVDFPSDENVWLVEELLAMELQSIRRNAEDMAGSGSSVRSAVITIPPYFTVEEKRAVELAAELAGLRVLALISDGLAVGLNYATSRQFPNVQAGEKAETNMVFDMGAGSAKASVLQFQSRSVKDIGKFNKTIQEINALGTAWDRTLGGDALNALIIDDMITQFVDTKAAKAASITAESVYTHPRTVAQMTTAAERARHVLSANSDTSSSFEGLFDDIPFRYKITRATFEKLAEEHAARVVKVAQDAVAMAGLQVADLDSVILHGGATRTPFVQKQLQKVFGADKLRTNVNSDEAAVFGAAFRAAEISPSFRVKEIRVADLASFGGGMKWVNSKTGKVRTQQLWTPTSRLGGTPKEITFQNTEDFTVDFYQLVPSKDGQKEQELVEAPTRQLKTTNLTATVALLNEKHKCDPSTIQFKLNVRLSSEHGEADVVNAFAQCEAEEVEKDSIVDGVKNLFGFGKKDQKTVGGDSEEDASSTESISAKTETSSTTASSSSTSTASESSASSASSASSSVSSAETPEKKPKKKVTVIVPVTYTVETSAASQLDTAEIQKLSARLAAFEASDKARMKREEVFNELESYAYKVRALLDNDDFIAVSTPDERATLDKMSHHTTEWLYEDGSDAAHDELAKRYHELQALADPIEARIAEADKRPQLLVAVKESLKQSHELTENIRKRIAEYETYQSSLSASSSSTSSTSSSTESSTTPAASADDFAGLEDDEPPVAADSTAGAAGAAGAADNTPKGPAPPSYTLDDLKQSEDLYTAISAWLAEKEAAQEKLGRDQDPVLTVKDLQAKKDLLDKASMDLALKAIRTYENTQKKAKGSKSKPKGSKGAKASKGSKAGAKAKKAAKSDQTSSSSSSSSTTSSVSTKPTTSTASADIKHEEL